MAFKKKAGRKMWRGIPVAFKVLALCAIALVALLLILPAPPERDTGGVTSIGKYVPPLRDTVDPLADSPLPSGDSPPGTASPPATQTPVPPAVPATPPSEPEAEPVQPEIAGVPETQPGQSDLPSSPLRKPENAAPPESSAAETGEDAQEQTLPWAQESEQASLPPARVPQETGEPGSAGVPSKADLRDWLRSQAWEFLGGVDDQGNILYRFEVWLEAPPDVLKRIKSVAYEYDAPSATPKSREVDVGEGGFRARFGGLACSKQVTITVTMADGTTRRTTADGCKALN